MAIETTLTIMTFLLIVAVSVAIRLVVMVTYRLIRRAVRPASEPNVKRRAWPHEGRPAAAGKAVTRAIRDGFVPLSIFVLATIAGAVTLVSISFVRGVASVAAAAGRTARGSVPALDRAGEWVITAISGAIRAPVETYSVLSPSAMFEDALWRAVLEGTTADTRAAGFMGTLRHKGIHPVLEPLLVGRRQAV